jgi:hypothetical protein
MKELAVPRFLSYRATQARNMKAPQGSEIIRMLVCASKHPSDITTNRAGHNEHSYESFPRFSLEYDGSSSNIGSSNRDDWSGVDNKLPNDDNKSLSSAVPHLSSAPTSSGRFELHERDQEIHPIVPCTKDEFVFNNERQTLVDTFDKLRTFLVQLAELPPSTLESPQVALDAEGVNLGRSGSLDLVQIYLPSLKHTFVLDILVLGGRFAFDYEHENGWSVRRLLESEILKIMWDPRQDQDPFWAHFGIKLGCIMCLQLIELVVRDRGRDRVMRMRLSDCIDLEGEAWMKSEEVDKWVRANGDGRRYFKKHGYEVFAQRPISSVALKYAAGDVDQMVHLWKHLYQRLTDDGRALVESETKRCLNESMLTNKPEGTVFAPEVIQRLPIIAFVPEDVTWVCQEYSESLLLADDKYRRTLRQEREVPEWERRSLEHAYKGVSTVAAQDTYKYPFETMWEDPSPNSWDTFAE